MVKAVQNGSTDGIGLGRPAAEEPFLPKQLLSGEVSSKIASKLDYNDFGVGSTGKKKRRVGFGWVSFSGSQMRRLGFGMEAMDSSDQGVVDGYLKEMEEFFGLMGRKMREGVVVCGNPRFGTPELPWEGS